MPPVTQAEPGPLRPPGDPAGDLAGFAGRQYRREPAEFDDPVAGFALSQDEMFRLLLRLRASAGTGPAAPQIRLHLGQRQVLADLDDYLPAETDESLDGYLARMDGQLHGEPYLLAVQHAHAASRPVWKRAAAFLAVLHDATGLPPGNADLEVFVGRYPSTAAGIHRERSGVFVSAAHGTKDMLVWPPETTGLPLGTLSYEPARTAARRLCCAPGRLVYWPAMYWHVGECPAGPTAALHLAVIEEPLRLPDMIARTVADLTADFTAPDAVASPSAPDAVASPSAPDAVASPSAPDEVGFPDRYEAAVRVLTGRLGDAREVRDRLTADWLRRRTGLGLTAPPPRHREYPVAETDVVIRDSVRPVILARRDAATSWCAADGRVADVRSAAALAELIDWINTGQPVPVRAGLRLASARADRELLRRVMSLLAAWRAVRVAR